MYFSKKVFKNYGYSVLTKGISIFYGLLSLKLLSTYLDENDFSNYYIHYNFVLYASAVFFIPQGYIILRYYYILGALKVNTLYSIFNTLSLLVMAGIGVLLWILGLIDFELSSLLLLLVIAYGFYNNEIRLFQIKHDFTKIFFMNVIQLLIAISLLWISGEHLTFKHTLLIILLSYVLSFIIFKRFEILKLFKRIDFKFLRQHKEALIYTYPISLIALLNLMLSSMDQYFLKYFGFEEDLAGYIANYTIGEKSFTVILSIITLVFVPTVFKKYTDLTLDTFRDIYKVVLIFVMLLITVIGVTLTFSDLLTRLLTHEDYVKSSWIIPWITFSGLFLGINSLASEVLTVKKRTLQVLIAYLTGVLSNFVLNLIFIKLYGVPAAVFTTIASYVIMLCLTTYFIYLEYKRLNLKLAYE